MAAGWHPPCWDWHSLMSISHPKWDRVRKKIPKRLRRESSSKQRNAQRNFEMGEGLTRAVFSIPSEAIETEA